MTGRSTGADPLLRRPADKPDGSAAPGALWVIIPVLDEATRVGRLLATLDQSAVSCVVVDGGSVDDTVAVARAAGALVIEAPRGRAIQMQHGADHALARGAGCLLFVHADCLLPGDALVSVQAAARPWGRFDVCLDASLDEGDTGVRTTIGSHRWLSIVGAMMNLRSALTGVCTGDQAIHVRADLFMAVGGFKPLPLMEDIDLSVRLRGRAGWPARHRSPVRVSARRWLAMGVWRCIGQMWWLRLRYFLGADPTALHAAYYRRPVTAEAAVTNPERAR